MFKTARFKVHNPSRHKRAMLLYAMETYHNLLRKLLEAVVARIAVEGLEVISKPDKEGKLRVNGFAISNLLYQITPKGLPISPLRDYLIGNAKAMLLSHFAKLEKAKNDSNPPTLDNLEPITDDEFDEAYQDFCCVYELVLEPEQQEKIKQLKTDGKPRVAGRIYNKYQEKQWQRKSGAILRKIQGCLPIPTEFTRPEFGRGFLLAYKNGNYYAMMHLFSHEHHYCERRTLNPDFIDWRTKEAIGGKKYSGVILPLELGREFSEEYLTKGRPQSAKLVAQRTDNGEIEFYIHMAFEFTPEKIVTETFLGIDRGAARIGAATIVYGDGRIADIAASESCLEGAAFSAEMAYLRAQIAERQHKGKQHGRFFRLRRRKADIIIGEYANRLVRLAVRFRAQVVLEALSQRAMAGFLTQSQFGKLKAALDYKLECVGLPKTIDVPAHWTSKTCSQCGHRARENRLKQAEFKCVRCGYEANADQNASAVIALKGLHQKMNKNKFQKLEVFESWLINECKKGGDNSFAQAASL